MIITLLRKPPEGSVANNTLEHRCGGLNIDATRISGRWPANFMIRGEEVAKSLDAQSGHQKSGVAGSKSRAWGVAGKGQLSSSDEGVGWKAYGSEGYDDEGGASRYFKIFSEEE